MKFLSRNSSKNNRDKKRSNKRKWIGSANSRRPTWLRSSPRGKRRLIFKTNSGKPVSTLSIQTAKSPTQLFCVACISGKQASWASVSLTKQLMNNVHPVTSILFQNRCPELGQSHLIARASTRPTVANDSEAARKSSASESNSGRTCSS